MQNRGSVLRSANLSLSVGGGHSTPSRPRCLGRMAADHHGVRAQVAVRVSIQGVASRCRADCSLGSISGCDRLEPLDQHSRTSAPQPAIRPAASQRGRVPATEVLQEAAWADEPVLERPDVDRDAIAPQATVCIGCDQRRALPSPGGGGLAGGGGCHGPAIGRGAIRPTPGSGRRQRGSTAQPGPKRILEQPQSRIPQGTIASRCRPVIAMDGSASAPPGPRGRRGTPRRMTTAAPKRSLGLSEFAPPAAGARPG